YVTQNKVNGEDFEAGTFLSKGTDTTENNEVLEKTLKKKVGKKGRKRHKSWVEQQPKKKKVAGKDKTTSANQLNKNDDVYSIANVIFDKFKDFLFLSAYE
ncbi:hypothetical protein Tco_0298235, partial [Tanacetum coccineum]